MKLLLSIFLLALLTSFGSSQNRVSERQMDGLQGKVKSVEVERTEIIDDVADSSRSFVYRTTYDELGNTIENTKVSGRGFDRVIYGTKNGQRTTKNLSFDDKGTILCFPPTCKNSDIEAEYHEIFSDDYNSLGQRIKRRRYDKEGFFYGTYNCEYDSKGHLLSETYVNSISRIWEETLRYDSDWNLIEDAHTSIGTGEWETFSYAYRYHDYRFDKSGNWIQRTESQTWSQWPDLSRFKHIDYRTIEYFPK